MRTRFREPKMAQPPTLIRARSLFVGGCDLDGGEPGWLLTNEVGQIVRTSLSEFVKPPARGGESSFTASDAAELSVHGASTQSPVPTEIMRLPNLRILEADVVTPGFVDIHNHGMNRTGQSGFSVAGAPHTSKVLAQHGTTSFLAGICIPDDEAALSESLRAASLMSSLTDLVDATVAPGAICAGIFAEGPIVETLGGLPPSEGHVAASLEAFEALLATLGPKLRMMVLLLLLLLYVFCC